MMPPGSRAGACAVLASLVCAAALAQDDRPVLAVEAFTGNVVEIDGGRTVPNPGLLRGFAELIVTDLGVTPNPCDLRLAEWLRRADVIREIELSQSGDFNPATAIPVGQLLQPDVFLRGTLNSDGTTATWSLQLVVAEGGRVVCKLEVGYAMAGVMDEATIGGTICGNLDKNFTARSPEVGGDWKFVPGSPDAGTFTYAAADVGGVTGSGSGTYTVLRSGEKAVRIQLAGTGAIHSPLGTFTAEITESIALTPVKTCGRVGDK
jgi:hypothetical protein